MSKGNICQIYNSKTGYSIISKTINDIDERINLSQRRDCFGSCNEDNDLYHWIELFDPEKIKNTIIRLLTDYKYKPRSKKYNRKKCIFNIEPEIIRGLLDFCEKIYKLYIKDIDKFININHKLNVLYYKLEEIERIRFFMRQDITLKSIEFDKISRHINKNIEKLENKNQRLKRFIDEYYFYLDYQNLERELKYLVAC